MSGVVFMICIPSKDYELRKRKKKVTIGNRTEIIHYDVNSAANFLHNKDFPKIQSPTSPSAFNRNNYQPMEKIVEDLLKEHNISNATWCRGEDNDYVQITFSLESNDDCDKILEILQEHKIGKRFNSVVNIIPCTVHFQGNHINEFNSKYFEESISESHPENKTGWNRFVSSVRSRLAVAQVVENVKVHAALTFDFVCLILISTLLCAIGLTENSNVYLLSSMLISPMMGPVMAGTFGSVIQDKRLQKTGVQNELIGLGIATLVGFCYGALICIITDKYGGQDWPTYEMLSRGELRTLWVGCLIALLSGAAVALGILSDNIASLVGVAISTSLMPPAVNAGLLWSMASIYYIKGNETTRYTSLSLTTHYCESQTLELLALGAVSVCLTFVNIVCIYVAGILVFKIKEVSPMASRDQERRRFWAHDIKVARDFNRIDCDETKLLYDSFYGQHRKCNDGLCHSTDLGKDNFKINIKRSEYTWSPCMAVTRKHSKDLANSGKLNKIVNIPKTKYRRLSQIFLPNNSDNDKLHIIDESSEKSSLLPSSSPQCSEKNINNKSTSFFTKTKKFIVTPCENDPLNV